METLTIFSVFPMNKKIILKSCQPNFKLQFSIFSMYNTLYSTNFCLYNLTYVNPIIYLSFTFKVEKDLMNIN